MSELPNLWILQNERQIGPGCSRKTPLEDPQGRDLLLELDIGATQLPVEIGKLWRHEPYANFSKRTGCCSRASGCYYASKASYA